MKSLLAFTILLTGLARVPEKPAQTYEECLSHFPLRYCQFAHLETYKSK
jgi:hypothetical protein